MYIYIYVCTVYTVYNITINIYIYIYYIYICILYLHNIYIYGITLYTWIIYVHVFFKMFRKHCGFQWSHETMLVKNWSLFWTFWYMHGCFFGWLLDETGHEGFRGILRDIFWDLFWDSDWDLEGVNCWRLQATEHLRRLESPPAVHGESITGHDLPSWLGRLANCSSLQYPLVI